MNNLDDIVTIIQSFQHIDEVCTRHVIRNSAGLLFNKITDATILLVFSHQANERLVLIVNDFMQPEDVWMVELL